ncbi:MAG TPA: glycosyltransferase [Acidimicrobiales bacterium]|nr:glycosyltransferase [Acidimicrobiales bacterium]
MSSIPEESRLEFAPEETGRVRRPPLRLLAADVPVSRRRLYLPVAAKFALAQCFAFGWMGLSVWLSLPWARSLGREITLPVALVAIALLAYVPGWLVAFLAASLLLDRQPPLHSPHPETPVTLLIPAHNEAERIADTLSYLARQDYDGPLHVIVIDNASDDGTLDAARRAAARLGLSATYLSEPTPGKSHALNTALRYVETDMVITLDADTALHPAAVRHLVARYESSPPDVTAVAGAVLVRNSRDNMWTRMQEWDYFLGIASIKRMQGLYQGTLVAQGAFSLYEVDAVRRIGGWPDAIGEDIVLTWRLMEGDRRVYFEPMAIAFTEVPSQIRHFCRQRARWARGMIEGIRSVKPWRQPRPMTAIMAGLDLLLPLLDMAYTLLWMPGIVMACFGVYWFVGIYTAAVLPITLLINALLYRYQRSRVFVPLDLRVRRNISGLLAYVLFYQMLMSPMSLLGYAQEVVGARRRWK